MLDPENLSIGHALGKGGQGEVFLAVAANGELRAVKIVELAADADQTLFRRRLDSFPRTTLEAPVVCALRHGRFAEAPGELRRQLRKPSRDAYLLVMPFIDGPSLPELLKAGPLDPAQVAVLLWQLAKKLARLPAGVAHGDLKPANVYVRILGEVVIADPDLTREPTPGDDLRALGGLGTALLGERPAADLAMQRFRQLLSEIASSPTPPQMAETAARFAALSLELGAPPDLLAALSKRAEAAAPKLGEAPKPRVVKVRKRWVKVARWVLYVPFVILAIGVIGIYASHPYVTSVSGPSAGVLTAGPGGGLYDKTGKVQYLEPVHELGNAEHLQAGDGFVSAEIGEVVPRIALLTRRKELLWERRKPEPGRKIYLDVKPGDYYFEIDRNLGAEGIQEDPTPVHIDVRHPYRLTIDNRILEAPEWL